ncbi:RNA 3'-terminal phosphate cyclase-like protein, putative [Plasmodium reichenowi]|uniref:RNA 3'-terminal phosphate cyclase-like protein, putative n=1 Tax=Plasmodium reichenowi TaxID=5854 RepID=A0A060S0Q1_PLARE|nr:RNA 3'-terminal phosphate cyclase-like protein, putative [Plasmodium reichenowi]SOV83532.1 RNA 3'-terminal phosphate cyclase-like protein, putative [Plasmodium reichenowi]
MEFCGSNFFRLRLALSLISGKAITIKNIRMKRKSIIKNGMNNEMDIQEELWKNKDVDNYNNYGLQEYEAKILKLIDKLCDNTTIKINEEGDELYFEPGYLIGNTNEEDSRNMYNMTFHCGKERSITYYLEFLIMIVLFFKNPVNILLKGITDDYIDNNVYTCKIICEHFFKEILKLNEDFLYINILKRSTKPECSGEVHFFMRNIKKINPFDITNVGVVNKISGSILSNNISLMFRNKIMNCAKKQLYHFTPYINIDVQKEDDKKNKNINSHFISFSLFAHTKYNCIYAADICVDELFLKKLKEGINNRDKHEHMHDRSNILEHKQYYMNDNYHNNDENILPSYTQKNQQNHLLTKHINNNLHDVDIYERLGFFISLKMINQIKGLSSVDTNYQWLPLLYMALAADTSVSKITLSVIKPYSITLIRLLRDFFNVVFKIEKVQKSPIHYSYLIQCVGIGYQNIFKKTF